MSKNKLCTNCKLVFLNMLVDNKETRFVRANEGALCNFKADGYVIFITEDQVKQARKLWGNEQH